MFNGPLSFFSALAFFPALLAMLLGGSALFGSLRVQAEAFPPFERAIFNLLQGILAILYLPMLAGLLLAIGWLVR